MTTSVAPTSARTPRPEKRTPLWAKLLLVVLVLASFYTKIVTAIDPAIALEFEFAH